MHFVRDAPEVGTLQPLSATRLQRAVRMYLFTCLYEMHSLAIGHSRGRSLYTCIDGCTVPCVIASWAAI